MVSLLKLFSVKLGFLLAILISAVISIVLSAEAVEEKLAVVSGKSLKSGQERVFQIQGSHKATVLVFLSAVCPCSNSHLVVLEALSEKHKDFQFVGIHSNADESLSDSEKYFKAASISFEVLQDSRSKIANQMKAFKTPHVFVISPEGQILYQGGVTNSSNAANATQPFLANALEDLSKGQKVRVSEGRTLGCIIVREGDKNAW